MTKFKRYIKNTIIKNTMDETEKMKLYAMVDFMENIGIEAFWMSEYDLSKQYIETQKQNTSDVIMGFKSELKHNLQLSIVDWENFLNNEKIKYFINKKSNEAVSKTFQKLFQKLLFKITNSKNDISKDDINAIKLLHQLSEENKKKNSMKVYTRTYLPRIVESKEYSKDEKKLNQKILKNEILSRLVISD